VSGPAQGARPEGRYLLVLSLTALGVVYGDIGTSPLYAVRECFHGHYAIAPTAANVLGVLSLIFWSLIFVISIKYLIFILRADNRGEGGIIALMSLIHPTSSTTRKRQLLLVAMGLFGAALLYGDGMITPAISVLSAVEGLEEVTPLFKPYVIPITVVILVALFAVQRRGTGDVGKVFGPITLIWFLTLGALGAHQVVRMPSIFKAINPIYAYEFFNHNGVTGFLVLGAVFLVVTGGEALYADIGHFGVRPIRLTWYTLVLPCLLLNYFGQGVLLLLDPTAVESPFYRMAPDWALYPLVALATAATVIASQAVISGSFSLTRQAVQLGYLPRLEIEHTSAREIGQIYIPVVNWGLMIACIGLVFGFRESSALAAAYGVAVTTDMVFTSILFAVFVYMRWKWTALAAFGIAAAFLAVDLGFWGAQLPKIPHGGWFPLAVAALVFTVMTTWQRGRGILNNRLAQDSLPTELFLQSVAKNSPHRVKGTSVFLTRNAEGVPAALLHNLKHNQVLHETVILLSVATKEVPVVTPAERSAVESLGHGFYRVEVNYGFTEDPDIPAVLGALNHPELTFEPNRTTYFLGRETLFATKAPGMALWRERLFIIMARNARSATYFFRLPPNRVVELGAQIEL
jgi:KUP system potassium uptake protein